MGKLLEFAGAGNEVGLAVYLHHGADAPAAVDIGLNPPLGGNSRRLFLRLEDTLLFQQLYCLLDIPLRLNQGVPSLQDSRPGACS